MTSLNRNKIIEKLKILDDYLKYLYKIKKESKNKKSFVSDFHLFGLAERYLHLSIQIVIDTSHLIIIDMGLERPKDNYEAISILYNEGILSEKLSNKISGMIGLRNILVHEYGKIDKEKVYGILENDIQDLEEFRNQIVKFIKSN